MKKIISILTACLLCLGVVVCNVLPAAAAELPQSEQEAVACSGFEEAAAVLREKMEKRESTITVTFLSQSDDSQVLTDLFEEAIAHTGVPTQGD